MTTWSHGVSFELDHVFGHLVGCYLFIFIFPLRQYVTVTLELDRILVFLNTGFYLCSFCPDCFGFRWSRIWRLWQARSQRWILYLREKIFFPATLFSVIWFTIMKISDIKFRPPSQDGCYEDRPQSFQVYAPCRTAVVYALVDEERPLTIESVEGWYLGLDHWSSSVMVNETRTFHLKLVQLSIRI